MIPLDLILAGLSVGAIVKSYHTSRLLDKSLISTNFGCYNRAGAEIKGNEFIRKERRKVASGELVMVACDIAGMGKLNTLKGELWVNRAIAACISDIRLWRGVRFISQINSGDEFAIVVDKIDAAGLLHRIDDLFQAEGFTGVYGVIVPLKDCYINSANQGMQEVYQLKQLVSHK